MRIYFSGAILGGRENLSTYQHIVAKLKSLGHQVPSEHVARPQVLDEEAGVSAQAVFERDLGWIKTCHLMIAEVSTPSLGVGYEISCAEHEGKPVLCLYREGLVISKMVTGNPCRGFTVATYKDHAELDRLIERFLLDQASQPIGS